PDLERCLMMGHTAIQYLLQGPRGHLLYFDQGKIKSISLTEGNLGGRRVDVEGDYKTHYEEANQAILLRKYPQMFTEASSPVDSINMIDLKEILNDLGILNAPMFDIPLDLYGDKLNYFITLASSDYTFAVRLREKYLGKEIRASFILSELNPFINKEYIEEGFYTFFYNKESNKAWAGRPGIFDLSVSFQHAGLGSTLVIMALEKLISEGVKEFKVGEIMFDILPIYSSLGFESVPGDVNTMSISFERSRYKNMNGEKLLKEFVDSKNSGLSIVDLRNKDNIKIFRTGSSPLKKEETDLLRRNIIKVIVLSPLAGSVSAILTACGGGGGSGGSGSSDTTPPSNDNIAPVLRDINIYWSNTYLTIYAGSDENAKAILEIGRDTSYGRSQSTGLFVKTHSFSVSDIAFSGAYHFRVTLIDEAENTTISRDYKFEFETQLPQAAPYSDSVSEIVRRARAFEFLEGQIDSGTGLIKSFYGINSDNSSRFTSWTFNDGQAIYAFVLSGEIRQIELAKKIADGMLKIQNSDGSWAEAYDSLKATVKYADKKIGPVSAMGKALLELYSNTGEVRYLEAAKRAANWIIESK
ncbi:MAG TPA: hypothetical protein PLU24_00785, partial [Candidatus Omnitrophota bacterium]|nr:hypothetical protein [Candidatus Omnitrophota bacterium]